MRPVWSAPRTARLKILLVEDHQATSAVMARLLRKLDHTALTAGSLDAALEVAGAADLDLLISDLGLPDGSGLELMSRIRAACRHGDRAEWVRERRGHPAEPGGGLRRPSDQARRPPEAGGNDPAGRLVKGIGDAGTSGAAE